MTVDLSKYVGQEVEVTYENRETKVHRVVYDKNYTTLPYKVGNSNYTKDGYFWSNRRCSNYNIVKVTPISKPMKKYEQLEKQVKEMQAEIERLKKEEEEQQQSKLPKDFDRTSALRFLKNPNCTDLSIMFYWDDTPEGESYWDKVFDHLKDNDYISVEVTVQIQKWVIESYIQEYGR